ncbi:MAG TPA: ATP synthase F1 subunit delta [Gaiellaceae bacterium]|nr:ATP synthase F1 subunit delta [Gaiellaceae bacterium]
MAAASRIYATALLEAAQESGRLPAVREELADLVAAVDEVPELAALLENPEVDPQTKGAVVRDLLADADELVRNYALLLVEKGRAGQLREIAREFDQMVARAEGRLDVDLTTAVELADDEAAAILRQIEQAAGRKIEATRRVDPDLIGGFILQAGTLRVDASVRGRLDRLRHELVRR